MFVLSTTQQKPYSVSVNSRYCFSIESFLCEQPGLPTIMGCSCFLQLKTQRNFIHVVRESWYVTWAFHCVCYVWAARVTQNYGLQLFIVIQNSMNRYTIIGWIPIVLRWFYLYFCVSSNGYQTAWFAIVSRSPEPNENLYIFRWVPVVILVFHWFLFE